MICIDPSSNYVSNIPMEQRKNLKAIKLRVIKLVSPDGTVSVLLTNLYDREKYSAHEIITLYFKRGEVETYYRDEKDSLRIETFHAKTCNGIRQELFSVMIMAVISRTLMVFAQNLDEQSREPQFKNAIMTLASEAAVLTAEDPETALQVFRQILAEIRRVKYYRPKKKRPSQQRVTKRSVSKWAHSKTRRVANA